MKDDIDIKSIISLASEQYSKCLDLTDIEINRINGNIYNDVVATEIHNMNGILDIVNTHYSNYAKKLVENDTYGFILLYLTNRKAKDTRIFSCLSNLFSFLDIELSFNMGVYLLKNYKQLSDFYSNVDPKKLKEGSLEYLLYNVYCDINDINNVIEYDNNYYSDSSIRMYLNEIGKFKVLSKEEEAELFKKYQENHDENAKRKIAEHNLRLAFSIASRFARVYPEMEIEDVVQFGNLGLLKAIDYFDYSKGFKFSTYATWWIGQAIRRGISDSSTTIRIPVHTRESITKMKVFISKYISEHDKEPSPEEIAQAVSLPVLTVVNYLKIIRHLTSLPSLDSPVGEEDDIVLADFVKSDEATTEERIEVGLVNEKIHALLNTLDDRSAFVLKKRFGFYDGHIYTLEEIGEELGITRERVRQIQNKAIFKLKKPYKKSILTGDESTFTIQLLDKKPLPKVIDKLSLIKGTDKYDFIMDHLTNKGKEILRRKYGEELVSNNYLDYKDDRYLNEEVLPKIDMLFKRIHYNSFRYNSLFKQNSKEKGVVNYYALPDSFKSKLITLYGNDLLETMSDNAEITAERSLYNYIIPELFKEITPSEEFNDFVNIFNGKYKTIPYSYASLLTNVFQENNFDLIVNNKKYDKEVVLGINYILRQILKGNDYVFLKKYLDQSTYDLNDLYTGEESKDKYVSNIFSKIRTSPHIRQINNELIKCMNSYSKSGERFNLYSFFTTDELSQLSFALSQLSFEDISIIKRLFPNDYNTLVDAKEYDFILIKSFYNIIKKLKVIINNSVSYNFKPVLDDNLYDIYRFCEYRFASSNFAKIVVFLSEEEKTVLVHCLTYNGGLQDALIHTSNILKFDYTGTYAILRSALLKVANNVDINDFKLNELEESYLSKIIRVLKR